MKKTWILAGALLVIAASAMGASAHGNKGGTRQGGMGMGRGMGMVKGARVGLSTQLGLSIEQQAQLDALKATLEEKELALRDEEQAAVSALLTPEQQAVLAETAASGGGRHHRRPVLNLSADQQTQFAALRTEYGDKHQALHAEFQTAFEALLTEEQQAKLAALRAAGPFGICTRAGAEIPAAGTSSTGTSTLSAAKVVVSDDEPATAVESTSWGQLKNAD